MMKSFKALKTNRRGQTSVEYLVLLAIAIVIAVVAVGVLSGFIKIGTATTYKKKGAIYWKSAEIGIMDWEIFDTSGGSQLSTLVLQNNKEYQITIDWISLNGGATTKPLDITLLPGDVYRWETDNITCQSGGSYSYVVTFQYQNKEHGVSGKRFTGIEKLAGSCSN
jgi:Flp pilus assembly pilin Flp